MASGDPKIAISDPIECEFTLTQQNGLENLINKYSTALNFSNSCGKK